MNIKNKMFALSFIATAATSSAQVSNGDFNLYSGVNSNVISTEINNGVLYDTSPTFTDWKLINNAFVYETTKLEGALFLKYESVTGANQATQQISISSDGFYTFAFESYTDGVTGNNSGFNAYIDGATVNGYKEVSDGASTSRSFTEYLTRGNHTLVFENAVIGNAENTYIDNVTVSTVPEPSSTALIGLGGLALILRRRK